MLSPLIWQVNLGKIPPLVHRCWGSLDPWSPAILSTFHVLCFVLSPSVWLLQMPQTLPCLRQPLTMCHHRLLHQAHCVPQWAHILPLWLMFYVTNYISLNLFLWVEHKYNAYKCIYEPSWHHDPEKVPAPPGNLELASHLPHDWSKINHMIHLKSSRTCTVTWQAPMMHPHCLSHWAHHVGQ
jgi:hypothetical protein